MQIVLGLMLIIIAAGMVTLARPVAGSESAGWLRAWPVGQGYALIALAGFVLGVALILNGWPA